MKTFFGISVFGILSVVTLALASIAAWFHHVIVCIQHQEWILLGFGALVPPIGVIHGYGLWFGWFLN